MLVCSLPTGIQEEEEEVVVLSLTVRFVVANTNREKLDKEYQYLAKRRDMASLTDSNPTNPNFKYFDDNS